MPILLSDSMNQGPRKIFVFLRSVVEIWAYKKYLGKALINAVFQALHHLRYTKNKREKKFFLYGD